MEFRVLGAIEVHHEGKRIELGPARQQCVLAVRLAEVNRGVPVDRLVDRVWGSASPAAAAAGLRSYLSNLRRALSSLHGVTLSRRSDGYVLTADPDTVDLTRFRSMTHRAARAGDDAAVALFEQALGLWRGDAFDGLDSEWLADLRTTLEAQRLTAELEYAELALRLGAVGGLASRLRRSALRHPADENVARLLMLTLHRDGRSAEALTVYAGLRALLVDELGVEPGAAARAAHLAILRGEPVVSSVPDRTTEPAAGPLGPLGPGSAAVPMQLPADARHFVGRAAELSVIDDAGRDVPATVLISGPPGVGKTALAVCWGHRNRALFPDGQLYVNLRGYDPEQPVAATDVLAELLRELGSVRPTSR